MKQEEKKTLSTWVWIIVVVLILISLGNLFFAMIGLAIGFACGYKNYEWAREIKKNTDIAFLIGYCFGLLGLLGYWIYYRNKPKKSVEQKEELIKAQKEKIEKFQGKDNDNFTFMLKVAEVLIVLVLIYFLIRWIF